MGFLNIPAVPIIKGQQYQMTVDKVALAADPKVAADSYFSNPNVWDRFVVAYQSSNTFQIENMVFDAKIASPQSNFSISEQAIGVFKILQFSILDFDGGVLELGRQDLTVEDYALDIPLKIAPSQLVLGVVGNKTFTVDDASNYKLGHMVRLFDKDTNTFLADEPRPITDIVGDVITVNPAFDTTVVADKHRLRFPHASQCDADQITNFYFNT